MKIYRNRRLLSEQRGEQMGSYFADDHHVHHYRSHRSAEMRRTERNNAMRKARADAWSCLHSDNGSVRLLLRRSESTTTVYQNVMWCFCRCYLRVLDDDDTVNSWNELENGQQPE